MRNILIDLSSDNYLEQPNLFGGYEGEHNETVLQVKLPKRMIDIECSGYRFDFQTSEDNKICSPLIPISELDNDVLSFHLTQQLTISGKLLFNVVAILSDENTVSLISKTNTVTLRIADSADGNMQLIDPDGYKDELQKMVDERIMEINPGIKNKDGGEVFTDYINNKATKDNTVFGSNNTSGMYGYKIIGWEGTGGGSSTPTAETTRTITVRDKDLDEGKKARDLWSIGNYVCLDCNYHVYDKIKISSISTDDAGNTKIVLTGIFFNSTSTGVDEIKPEEPDIEMENWISNKNKPLTGEPSPYSISAVSFGNKNIARGKASFTSGRENFTYGDYGFTTGRQNKAGYASFAGGRHNEATGEHSLAYGWQNKAMHYASAALGQNLITSRDNQTVVGRFNTGFNAVGNDSSLFVVGNGSSENSRSDAFVVKQDGTAALKKQGTGASAVTRKDYVDESIKKKVDEYKVSYENDIKPVKDALELDESSKINFSVTDATEYKNDKYPSPVDGQYYALNNSSLKSECEQIYHDSIQPTMAICFNHEHRYKVGIDPTTLTDSEDKATYQHLPGVISLYKNKYLHRWSRCGDGYFQRMRLICSLSPVDVWDGATPVFKKAKNFKTSFIFGFLPPASVASESTLLRSTMIFGFRQSSPSKFVNGFKVVNKNQCLLAVSKKGYYFAFGDNIKDNKVYIESHLDFSNSFETPLTEQNCLFEIEVVNDKCHVIIHNGELTTDPIYFDHTFDCPYYNPDTEDGSGYIGYGIGAYTGMFGNIDLSVLYDDKYKETASKEYVDSRTPEMKLLKTITLEEAVKQFELTFDTPVKDMYIVFIGNLGEVINDGIIRARNNGGSQYFLYKGSCSFPADSTGDLIDRVLIIHAREICYDKILSLGRWESTSSPLMNTSSVEGILQGASATTGTPLISYSTRYQPLNRYIDNLIFSIEAPSGTGKAYTFAAGSTLRIYGVEVNG